MKRSKITRFAIVGVANTVIDIVVFVTLRQAGLPVVVSNICSTSVALAASFILNRRFTFKVGSFDKQTVMRFVGITLFGLWIIQPIIIRLVMAVDLSFGITDSIAGIVGFKTILVDLIPKLISIGATLVWNYLWYSRVIFADKKLNIPMTPDAVLGTVGKHRTE